MNNSDDDDIDADALLRQRLDMLREADRKQNPNQSRPPSPPLPLELQSEIKVATTLIKLLFKSESQSLIFSPSVISGALTSMISDVDEVVVKEIENILGKDLIYNKEYFKSLLYSNCLFYSNKLTLIPSPVHGLKELEDRLKPIDFHDGIKATEQINAIISEQTKEKISTLIETSDITRNFSICLGIAASFEGRFEEPFTERKASMFYSSPPRIIDMVYQKEGVGWHCASGEGWTCLGLPYRTDGEHWLYIVLPKERNGLADLIEKFDYSMIHECLSGSACEANAAIPVFEVESQITLNNHLKQMGFTKLFEKNSLSQIFSDDNPHGLDMIMNSSKIKVDEYGTYAQPFRHSGDRVMAKYMEIEFVADHPFIFLVGEYENEKFKSLPFVGTFS